DPRNPATIADNVGDNVGDVAGMGADLFGSYVATMLAAMVLGNYVINDHTAGVGMDNGFGGIGPIMLPILIAGLGIIFSIIGTLVVKIKDESAKEKEVQRAFNIGNWGSIILTGISTYFVIQWMLPETLNMTFFGEGSKAVSSLSVFYAVIVGLVVGGLISYLTEYYTAIGKKPVNTIVQNSSTGAATNIIAGLSQGMMSTFFPVLLFAAAIWAAYAFAGFYGVAIAASAMMATTAMQLAIDAFGPIADNAGGIAEMSELPSEVRTRTDILDTVGNTTAATGKGFAIASAALTALALFAAYVTFTGIDGINIFKAPVLASLFVGAMIPVVFSALAMSAVGKAAMAMVKEVRRQFRDIPGIMEGKAEPEYDKCVEISTEASLKEMMLPGLLTIVTPLLIAFGTKLFTGNNLLAAEVLGGYMAGVTVSGVMWAIFQNNAGGAWDNAKKSFEAGVMIDGEMTYKGSEAHKAAVTGDTVGDPFKDTSGPSMNILIKLTCLVGLVIAPILGGVHGEHSDADANTSTEAATMTTASADGNALNGSYSISPQNSQFRWVGKKVTGQHSGTLDSRGEVIFEENKLISGNIEVDMTSIKVLDIKDAKSNADLTGHLMSDDFFGVENYPGATLRIGGSKMVNEEGVYSFEARLTMKDKTSNVKGEYRVVEADGTHKIEGGFTFDRTQHDVKFRSAAFYSDLGDKLIYDEVPVSFSVKL
ncbi:MAG: sodium-translocating pyrophosphatase, partial [Cryomorphaceae bacterium]